VRKTFLGLLRDERNHPVCRIIGVSRLCQMFAEKANYLVKPFKWDDPFENFIARLKGRLPNGEVVEFAQRYDFYGQCWTRTGGTDAMWRIYSSDKRSVRIKVRISRLYEQLAVYAKGPAFIGRVRYLSERGLQDWARRVMRSTKAPTIELLAKSFLIKRHAFSHENEVRLLYCGTDTDHGNLYRHPFDCHGLIEEVQLDPRLTSDEATRLAADIRERTGYRGRIVPSELYRPPPEFALPLNDGFAALRRSRARITYAGEVRNMTVNPNGVPQLVVPFRTNDGVDVRD